MPRGRPRKQPDIIPDTVEQEIATYLMKNVCMIPGCDWKTHVEDAKNMIRIYKREVEI